MILLSTDWAVVWISTGIVFSAGMVVGFGFGRLSSRVRGLVR